MRQCTRVRGYQSDGDLATPPASRPRTVAFADDEPIEEGNGPARDDGAADAKGMAVEELADKRVRVEADVDDELMVWAGGCHSFIGYACKS